MRRLRGRISRLVLGIPAGRASAARRGLAVADAALGRRLDQIVARFLAGYHLALADSRPAPLAAALERIEAEERGWAFEGAAMGLALLDGLVPWGGGRLGRVLEGPGAAHVYMMHVGAGWALARLPGWAGGRVQRQLDPLLRWLALDGYGFHEGYFRWPRYREGTGPPRRVRGYARRAFDQGLGRALWFITGADPRAIAAAIARFDRSRRGDLWSGAGLACAYAGGVEGRIIESLAAVAGEWAADAGQGAAFAAKARARAGNPAPHTELACRILCGASAVEAASIAEAAMPRDDHGDEEHPAYERWRRAIRQRMARPQEVAA